MDIIIFAIVGVVVGLGIGFAIAKSLEKKKASGTIQEAENRASGIIKEIGPNVSNFSIGDKVAYSAVPLGAYSTHRIYKTKNYYRYFPYPVYFVFCVLYSDKNTKKYR